LIPIISIVGRKDSGKTTFVTQLISLLEGRGMRVACVKQCRRDVAVDVEGKDSWRYSQAGASLSIMSTSEQLSLVYKRPQMADFCELAHIAMESKSHILIGESFNTASQSDIADRYVVARAVRNEEPRFSPEESFAIITDDLKLADCWLESGSLAFDLNDAEAFADFLCEHYQLFF